jgi:NADH:ubiquinone oxidoreductase subunit F (NADH-binding)
VKTAPCVGRCEQAPVAVVGRNPVAQATPDAVSSLVAAGRIECPVGEYVDYARYRAHGGYKLAADCLSGKRDAEEIIKIMESSGLRGLGGAGFPAGRKWRIVRAEPAPRVMAVNIDEGEPGTFKDRHYLERDPHRFIEGMLIAAWAVQISEIYIYLRDEYAGCRAILERELAAITQDPPCELPAIFLRRGAGAYICGEESAMIESIEGKRGMPRLRPPYVAQVGVFGRPTLEHNMETLYWVRQIVEQGAEWFAGHGRHDRKGLRSFSVSGRVAKPGVHLAPAGITVRELIDEYCGGMLAGHQFYGYLPGGASGGILPASLGDIPLDFDTLHPYGCFIGSAAVIVLSDKDTATLAARNVMKFFADESCGQCTPCRVGTAKAVGLMAEPKWDQPLLEELSAAMADASICGLGQAAPNPIRCVMKYFPDEIK